MNKYKLGLIDAPWLYDNQQQNDPKRGGITYPTLTMEELYNIPMGKAFEQDSTLVYWVTIPKLMDTYYEKYDPLSILRQWGYRPVTALFVWIKTNKRAGEVEEALQDDFLAAYDDTNFLDITSPFYSGLGRYTNSNVEIALIARRGKPLERLDKKVKQLIISPIRGHSEKPREQYNRLHRLFGDIPRVEIFARKQNAPPEGWDATGLDFDGVDIRDWIKRYE